MLVEIPKSEITTTKITDSERKMVVEILKLEISTIKNRRRQEFGEKNVG